VAEPDLIALAQRVSDGESVDWDAALRDAPEDGARRVVRNLRLLESLSSFHRTGSTGGAAAASGGDAFVYDATSTVASGEPSSAPADSAPGAARTVPIRPFAWGSLEVRERLGEGGFGEVHRAWDPTLQREVALKLLKREHRGGAGFEASVLHEARLLARVRHPHVVTVYGADTHDGRVGLWMELVRGRSLAQWVESQGRLGAREAAVLGVDLCRALAAVHGAGLVHRDVKAGNVMREEGGRILLMDFGAVSDASASDEGTVSGTPRYMAPEIYAGEKATPRSDLFSLGVLLYHLVTGRYPIDARTVPELREKIARREARLLRDERPDLPEAFVVVVERALAWRPEDRYPTAGAMEQALSAFLGAEGIAPRPSIGGGVESAEEAARVAWAKDRRRRGRNVGIGIAVGVVTAIAVAIGVIGPGLYESPPAAPPSAPPGGGSAAPPGTAAIAPGGTATPAPPPVPASAPYTVEASLQRVSKDGSRERLDSGSRLALGDQLALEVRASVPVHVYVIDEDETGHAYALFPLPDLEPKNPLPAETTVLLPGLDAERRQAYWSVTSVGGREHLMVLASPERIVEFEAEMANLRRPERGVNATAIPEEAMARLRGLRGLGGLVRATHPAPAPAPEKATNLFDMAEKLAGKKEQVTGPWLRRIDLENPAR